MAKYPTTQSNTKLKAFLEKIPSNGVPSKLNNETLSQWGFGSSNDRAFISVCKFIGFTDGSSTPNDLWQKARSSLGKAVAEGLLQGYSELYEAFPNAHTRPVSELTNYFRSKSDGDATTVTRTVNTFTTLAGVADFGTGNHGNAEGPSEASKHTAPSETAGQRAEFKPLPNSGGAVVINVNIQLQLPADATAETFDRFFKSMKNNLLQ